MNKIDIIIPTVVFIFIVGAGIFFISEWLEEKTMTLSERMVNNINSMTPAQTSCKELTQGIRELPETLEDYELVKKALTLKSIEMECEKYSSSNDEIVWNISP
jgi:ABC-type oligopeptide transport system substrate-binding subunit